MSAAVARVAGLAIIAGAWLPATMSDASPTTTELAVSPQGTPMTAHLSKLSIPVRSEPAPACCPIVELRQYTLHPGRRDVLIDLFDRHFVETQEATGMQVIGQFRDLDHPDRFVWLRGFPDMPARAQALGAFYGGPVWKAHREAANATMIDSDNVLLLRPAGAASGFALENETRAAPGASAPPPGLIVATIYYFDAPVGADFLEFFEQRLTPALTAAGTEILAAFVTEAGANTFPALPVREGEHVFVWFARFADPAAYERHRTTLARSESWRELAQALRHRLNAPAEVLRLAPTARSRLHD